MKNIFWNIDRMRWVLGMLYLFCLSDAFAEFVHPGVTHSQASIDFVKEKIAAGEEPWTTAWEKLRSSRYADLDWKPEPHARVERGPSNNPDIGSSEFTNDGRAAYYHSLCWTLTGKEAHAKKAAEILDAWSATLKSIGHHDARLLIGMSGYHYCIAAELIRHTWNGWPEAKQAGFRKMLREIWYPVIVDFYPSANGNWDASMLQCMIGMGVFLDDRAMFDRAKDYYLSGKGNGAIGNYFMESGQCQETGRDQAHTQMGLEFLANTCETAWIQGIDLYGALDNRLLKGFEYTAKYNLGFDVPYEPYRSFEGRYHYKKISDDSRGRLRPMYERVYNHFHNRKGLNAPHTQQAALKLRTEQPERRDRRSRRGRRRRSSSSELDILMFAGQPATFAARRKAAAAKSHSDGTEASPARTSPNIILILTDDQGYGDLGRHGHPLLKTPHTDRLHDESVRFDNFYVSPSCSPTRAALLTGIHEFRNGVTHTQQPREHLNRDAIILPQLLQKVGYRTGFIGKWHLGGGKEYVPNDRGFEWTVTNQGGPRVHFDPIMIRNGKRQKRKGYRENLFFDEAMTFIDANQTKNREQGTKNPFFCYLSTYSPHTPLAAPEEFIAPFRGKVDDEKATYLAMVANIDMNVGRLLKFLKDRDLEENTIVVFMNDNGQTKGLDVYNAGMRGCKCTIWEGGSRAMSFWRWPGHWQPHQVDNLTAHLDVVPTLCKLAGVPIPADLQSKLDGFSLVPLLEAKGPTKWHDDRLLFHHVARWPGGLAAAHQYAMCAVRQGNHLLLRSNPCNEPKCENYSSQCTTLRAVRNGLKTTTYTSGNAQFHWGVSPPDRWVLFNRKADPACQNDLSNQHPQLVKKLAIAYDNWWTEIFPQMIAAGGDKGEFPLRKKPNTTR